MDASALLTFILTYSSVPRPSFKFRRLVAEFSPRRPGFMPPDYICWVKWHWDCCFSRYFDFFLPIYLPDRLWGPHSLLYRVSFQEVKRPGRGVNHPPPFSAEVKERVELCLYSPSGSSWPFPGRNLLYFTSQLSLRQFSIKGKVRPITCHGGTGGSWGIALLFL
jgi:hypothetical protein